MASERRLSSHLKTAGEVCLVAALAIVVAGFGGASPLVLWPLCVTSLAALLFALASARLADEPIRLPVLGLVFVVSAALCLLQLIPLPLSVLSWLSPSAAELVRFNLEPLGLSTSRPISLDPPSTWRELAKALSYLCVFLAAAQLSASRRSRRHLAWAVSGAGVAVAVTAFGHWLTGSTALFGVHTFSVPPPVMTPFGNPNHLAGFLTVTGTLTLGMLLEAKEPPLRIGLALGYLAQGALVLFSLSRAGICFFLLAQLVLVVLLLRAKRRALIAVAALASVLAVGGYVAFDELQGEVQSADSLEKLQHSKIHEWPAFALAAERFSRLGMGRGSFELGFPAAQSSPSYYTFTHPENELLQLWSEFGIPATLLLLALAAYGVLRLLKKEEPSVVDLAALAALFAVSLHNLFDFSFELSAVPVAALIATGAAARRGELRLRGFLGPAVATVALLMLLSAARAQNRFEQAEASLSAAIARGDKANEVEKLALPLIDAHPSDALLYSAVGLSYANDRTADPRLALAWLNRGLNLSPWHGPSHEAVARALLRLGRRNQAFYEYRLALEASAGVPNLPLVWEAVRAAKTVDELTRLTPREATLLNYTASHLWSSARGNDAMGLLSSLLPELPNDERKLTPLLTFASFETAMKQFDAAEATLKDALALSADDPRVPLARAQLLNATGKGRDATALLEKELTAHPGDGATHLALARQYLANGEPNKAIDAASRAQPFVVGDDRVALFTLQSDAYQSQGRSARAIETLEVAARLQPSNVQLRYRLAELYASIQRFDEADKWLQAGAAMDSPKGAESAKRLIEQLKNDAATKLDEARLTPE